MLSERVLVLQPLLLLHKWGIYSQLCSTCWHSSWVAGMLEKVLIVGLELGSFDHVAKEIRLGWFGKKSPKFPNPT